jgi:tetratricopeptide (TPR) repeat protein
MSSTARILRFPARKARTELAPQEVTAAVQLYLDQDPGQRSEEIKDSCLANAEVVFRVLSALRSIRESNPKRVAEEAIQVHKWLSSAPAPLGLFDEHDYFLGEAALLAAGAIRLLGQRTEADRWLWSAEASFHLTVNPAPALAQVSYTRIALKYDMGEYDEVLEVLPALASTFRKLGMQRDFAKSKLFEAMTMKIVGRHDEALATLNTLVNDPSVKGDTAFYGRALVDLGDIHQQNGHSEKALGLYQEALPLLQAGDNAVALADLKAVVGATYRSVDRLPEAVVAYRSAKADFVTLGMQTRVAYIGVLAAEVLLALDRPREAEWEILQALPTIEEQKMVPEGFAAVALLRESVKRRKADPNALRELREHLQKQK